MRMPVARNLARRAFSAAACQHRVPKNLIFTFNCRMPTRRRSLSIAAESGADTGAIVKKQDLLDIGEARLTARENRLEGSRQSQERKGTAGESTRGLLYTIAEGHGELSGSRLSKKPRSTNQKPPPPRRESRPGIQTASPTATLRVGSCKSTAMTRGEQKSDKATQLRRDVRSTHSAPTQARLRPHARLLDARQHLAKTLKRSRRPGKPHIRSPGIRTSSFTLSCDRGRPRQQAG